MALNSVTQDDIQALAERLRQAEETGVPCPPIRDHLPENDVESAYAVQKANTEHWLKQGRRLVGRKDGPDRQSGSAAIGCGSAGFRRPAGRPDDGGTERKSPPAASFSPRVEAEIALILENGLEMEQPALADVIRATACAVPAIEVVASRVANWGHPESSFVTPFWYDMRLAHFTLLFA